MLERLAVVLGSSSHHHPSRCSSSVKPRVPSAPSSLDSLPTDRLHGTCGCWGKLGRKIDTAGQSHSPDFQRDEGLALLPLTPHPPPPLPPPHLRFHTAHRPPPAALYPPAPPPNPTRCLLQLLSLISRALLISFARYFARTWPRVRLVKMPAAWLGGLLLTAMHLAAMERPWWSPIFCRRR